LQIGRRRGSQGRDGWNRARRAVLRFWSRKPGRESRVSGRFRLSRWGQRIGNKRWSLGRRGQRLRKKRWCRKRRDLGPWGERLRKKRWRLKRRGLGPWGHRFGRERWGLRRWRGLGGWRRSRERRPGREDEGPGGWRRERRGGSVGSRRRRRGRDCGGRRGRALDPVRGVCGTGGGRRRRGGSFPGVSGRRQRCVFRWIGRLLRVEPALALLPFRVGFGLQLSRGGGGRPGVPAPGAIIGRDAVGAAGFDAVNGGLPVVRAGILRGSGSGIVQSRVLGVIGPVGGG
jgi:hypothetical protein